MENETVWLNRQQMAVLFDRDVKTIGKHIKNALNEELKGFPVVAFFATTASDGKTYQVEYFSLDMILSVVFRVKSKRGIEFRQWANTTLKKFLLQGYAVNYRLSQMENQLMEHERVLAEHSEKIDFFVRTALPPVEGVFYEGQIFDAYTFASDLIKSAKESIVLIDNYIDESVLLMLSKRKEDVLATIVTRRITETLRLDLERHRQQYPPIEVQERPDYHDRFLIIDGTVYHLGASLKDLGKRLFAFSKLELPARKIL